MAGRSGSNWIQQVSFFFSRQNQRPPTTDMHVPRVPWHHQSCECHNRQYYHSTYHSAVFILISYLVGYHRHISCLSPPVKQSTTTTTDNLRLQRYWARNSPGKTLLLILILLACWVFLKIKKLGSVIKPRVTGAAELLQGAVQWRAARGVHTSEKVGG